MDADRIDHRGGININKKIKYLRYKKQTIISLRKMRNEKRNLKDWELFTISNKIFRIHCKLISISFKYYRIRADFRYFGTHNGKFKQCNFKKSKAYKLRYS